MKVVTDSGEMSALSREVSRSGRRVGFVPTMGFLHEGHLSLIRLARARAEWVVVSLFVNPLQFGPNEDFDAYPRDQERDEKLCREGGADVLFCPTVRSFYAADHSVYVEETRLTRGLCGACRPGHFRGVTTVVAKLLNVVQADVAVFGQKDAQQVRVIQKMVRDLDFPVEIVVGPTLREPDGLAMSSRNKYLSPAERLRAASLSLGLRTAEALFAGGERSADVLKQTVLKCLVLADGDSVEYVEAVDFGTFEPVERAGVGTLLALAVRIGRTRLIDNLLLGGFGSGEGASSGT